MEHILILVLSVLLIVDVALLFYWMNKCNTYKRSLHAILSNQKVNWNHLIMLEIENSTLKAKLKELKEGAE